MRRFFTKKRSFVALAAVAVLAIAGGAYAYFSSTGTGNGSASVGTSTPFAVTSDPAAGGPLYPDSAIGGPNLQTVTYHVQNTNPGAQNLNQVIVSVAPGFSAQANAAEPACTANDFSIEGQAVGSSWTDTRAAGDLASGQTVSEPITIEMIDNGANQDNCQRVTVPLVFSAS
jgi:predicted ribosomally synthesized peptide with SipW-like signal peptide